MSGIPDRISVAIVGAGPVGLMAANLLGRLGVEVLVIERNPATMDIPRAIVIDDEGARTLQAAGLDGDFMDMTLPARGARYHDANGTPFADVGPGPVEYGYPRRNYIHQPEFEKVLLSGLDRFPAVQVMFSTELLDHSEEIDGVRLTIRDAEGEIREVLADYLLACDGARSPVRRRLGIEMRGNTYPEDWLIFDMHNDPDLEPVSKFYCRIDRPYVSIPAPRGGRRYEFRLMRGERAEEMLRPEAIRTLLEPIRAFRDEDLWRATVYTFEARLAERWRVGRVFLLGDAAHLTPPFAGQGMNAGLRDAHNLTWKIAAMLKGAAGEGVLDSYHAERHGPAWAMVQLAVAMGDIVMPADPADVAFRDGILAWMDRIPESRDYLIGMKFKPPPRYQAGAFLALEDQPFDGSLVGRMAPQPRVRTFAGEEGRLDDILGPGFGLIAQTAADDAFLRENADLLWPELVSGGVGIADFPEGGATAATLRAHRDQILLLRPDRYVAAAFWRADAEATVSGYRDALRG